MYGSRFFPVVYLAGGGGGTIPSITADTTLNVPGDYATLTDAINYVLSAVVLNGAQITVEIEDTETLTDQITLDGVSLPYLHIRGLGAGPTIDGAAFVASPIGTPAWLYAEDSALGEVYGTFRNVNCGAAAFFINLNSHTRFGSLANTLTVAAGFAVGVINLAGHHGMTGTTMTGAAYSLNASVGSETIAFNCTLTGQVLVEDASATINTGSITVAADSAIVAISGAMVSLKNPTVTGRIVCSDGAQVSGIVADLAEPAGGIGIPSYQLVTGQGGSANLNVNAITLLLGTAVGFAYADTGSHIVVRASNTVTNASTGLYAYVQGASQVNAYQPAGWLAFAGGASQPLYVANAGGLIIA